MLPHFPKVAAAHTLDEWQVKSVHIHPFGNEGVHQHAVNRGGGAVLVVVSGRIRLDALRQRLEMLAHRIGSCCSKSWSSAWDFDTDDSRLVQVEQHILVHHVLDTFRAFDLLERLLLLVEEKHITISKPASRMACLMASNTAPSELLNSTVAQRRFKTERSQKASSIRRA